MTTDESTPASIPQEPVQANIAPIQVNLVGPPPASIMEVTFNLPGPRIIMESFSAKNFVDTPVTPPLPPEPKIKE